MPIWIIFLLLGAGLVAILVEIFVPAGGIIGIAGVLSILAGIILGFIYHDMLIGFICLGIAIIAIPALIGIAFKIFPKTLLGKKLILKETISGTATNNYESIKGKEGIALTVLRPSGFIEIEDKKYTVVTQGAFVSKGNKVKIVSVYGNKIIVKKIG